MPERDRPEAAASRLAFEAVLTRVQNPARLTGGETGAGPGFTGEAFETRVVVAFPDTYEVGISNQAVQILYHLAKDMPGVGVERAYLPWIDVIAEMRRESIPLLSLETWTPVRDAHLLGVTLQHELNYTNLLELLDLAGVPLRARDRDEGDPLVVVGGPAVADFLPVAPFVDAVVLGDGEEVFPELLGVMREAVRGGWDRTSRRQALAKLEGCFVPGISRSVGRRVIRTLEGSPYPAECLVPITSGVHDRAWVEVMRGCTRGCRFCQAGMWYRPVRERSAGAVVDLACAELAATGHEEVSLASLSTTDYSAIEQVLGRLSRELPDVRINLPSLRVDSAGVRLAHLTSPTSPSVTLAPEAGSQRMRDVINKNITEADIIGAAREAFGSGHTGLKLYFMIGLPGETDDDVRAIVDLTAKLRTLGREILGSRASRLQVNVSVTNFVPKAFTPFQWVGMADSGTLRARHELLRQGFRRLKIRPALHDVEWSYVEAALARGGEDLAEVIEGAWRRGTRFDAWTEVRRLDAWQAAFAEAGLSAEQLATTPVDVGAPLPWDVIDAGVVSRGYLANEWERALAGISTPDCRWEGCLDCGACEDGLAPALAPDASAPAAARRSKERPTAQGGLAHRYVLRFSVEGRGVYVGHLDTVEVIRRAVRRAGGRLALSEGIRPKARLAVSLPRGVGVIGRDEVSEFTLAARPPADFTARIAAALPAGFAFLGLEPYHHARPVAARVVAARYRVVVAPAYRDRSIDALILADAATRYTCATELVVQRKRPDGRRDVDVRAFVDEFSFDEVGDDVAIDFRARVTPRGSVRPEEMVEAVSRLTGVELRSLSVERCAIELD